MGQLISVAKFAKQATPIQYNLNLPSGEYLFDFSHASYIPQKMKEAFIKRFQSAIDRKQMWFDQYGLRFVTPYSYRSRKIIEHKVENMNIVKHLSLANNFDKTEDFYSSLVERGEVSVINRYNEKQLIDKDYDLRLGDEIQYQIQDHTEPPVYNLKINVIADTDQFLAIDKPTSIPIATSQKYFRNSMHAMLCYRGQHFPKGVYPIDLISNSFSGISLMVKEPRSYDQQALDWSKLQHHLQHFDHEKRFLIRVEGRFPQTPQASIYRKLQFRLLEYDARSDTSLIDGTYTYFNNKQRSYENQYIVTQSKNINSNIRAALKELNFPILNDLQNGGRLVGNLWLELKNKEIIDEYVIKEYHKQIMKNHSLQETASASTHLNSSHLQSTIEPWDINKLFEMFVHYYSLQIDDGHSIQSFYSQERPYWRNSGILQTTLIK